MSLAWKIDFTPKALKQLKKLPPDVRRRIVEKLEIDVVGRGDPRLVGEAMIGEWTRFWRYRIGDYRAICRIHDAVVTVFVIDVGHRREIYR